MYIIRLYTDTDDFFNSSDIYEDPDEAHADCVLYIKNGIAFMCEVVHLYTQQSYCTVYDSRHTNDNSQELIN